MWMNENLPWSPGQFHEQASGMEASWSRAQYSFGTYGFHYTTQNPNQ